MYSGLFLFISDIEVHLCDEDIWMTQASLAELFQTSIANISVNIRNIYKAGELSEGSTIKLDLKVQKEGLRTVNRALEKYTLEQRKEWFGAACFSMALAYSSSGLIARSWSTEAQGNTPAFLFLWHRKERGDGTSSSKKTGILGRPIPILPYRSSLSRSMTNPWISKQRAIIFLICTPPPVVQNLGHISKILMLKLPMMKRFCQNLLNVSN